MIYDTHNGTEGVISNGFMYYHSRFSWDGLSRINEI